MMGVPLLKDASFEGNCKLIRYATTTAALDGGRSGGVIIIPIIFSYVKKRGL